MTQRALATASNHRCPQPGGAVLGGGTRQAIEDRRALRHPMGAAEEISSVERVYFEPGSPRRGRETFVANRCETCHAIVGTGARGGPNLGSRGREVVGSVSEVAGVMWNHSMGIEDEARRRGLLWPRFQPGDTADLSAFLLARRGTAEAVASRGRNLRSEDAEILLACGSHETAARCGSMGTGNPA